MAIIIDEKICNSNKEIHNIPMNTTYNKVKNINCSEILTSTDSIIPTSNCKIKNKDIKHPKANY